MAWVFLGRPKEKEGKKGKTDHLRRNGSRREHRTEKKFGIGKMETKAKDDPKTLPGTEGGGKKSGSPLTQ